jgi:predicted Rossmann fold nucleotide-binding protein DprA/Smf involved in DNA uptake
MEVAILVVHHLRKAGHDQDVFEKVSGTFGLTAVADSVLILDRDAQGTTLYGRGRDIPEIEKAVEFNKETCRWRVLGNAIDVHRTSERKAILAALQGADGPMSPSEIAAVTGMSPNNVKQLLLNMGKANEVQKRERGRYVTELSIPEEGDLQ